MYIEYNIFCFFSLEIKRSPTRLHCSLAPYFYDLYTSAITNDPSLAGITISESTGIQTAS